MGMELPSNEAEDFLYWKFHNSDKLIVKIAYVMLAIEDSSECGLHTMSAFYKTLWPMNILPKWKLFIWKLLHNGIATKVNLERQGIQVSTLCDVCSAREEDLQHLFRF